MCCRTRLPYLQPSRLILSRPFELPFLTLRLAFLLFVAFATDDQCSQE